MALTERTRSYETLIRHNDDGTVNAHHLKINEVLRDDVVISASVLSPGPVVGEELAAVLGDATQTALLNNASLREQVSRLQQSVVDLEAKLAAADGTIATLRAPVGSA